MGSQPASSSSSLGKSLLAAAFGSILIAANAGAATLQSAQDALSKGETATAARIYDDLSREGESLAAELGIIRAALQDGEFRKAVAHANQTAGEHPDSTDAAAMLAFLLDRSGRTEQALSSLQVLER